jgi:hypothetical protein
METAESSLSAIVQANLQAILRDIFGGRLQPCRKVTGKYSALAAGLFGPA